jgi:hypothetical protein
MSDITRFTVDQVREGADHVIAELRDDPDEVMMIPIPNGMTARERRDMIDHHGRVVAEIRKRSWPVKTHVRTTPTGSVLAIDLRP